MIRWWKRPTPEPACRLARPRPRSWSSAVIAAIAMHGLQTLRLHNADMDRPTCTCDECAVTRAALIDLQERCTEGTE
jgi:hypothetical protein